MLFISEVVDCGWYATKGELRRQFSILCIMYLLMSVSMYVYNRILIDRIFTNTIEYLIV